MTQTFYTQWQSSVLADAETYVSKEYSNFQTALLREISKYAEAVDAAVVWGIERSGFFNGREKWAKGFENQRV